MVDVIEDIRQLYDELHMNNEQNDSTTESGPKL